MKKIFILSVLLVLQTACTSAKVLRDHEYERSVTAARMGDFASADEFFPEKEAGGFITSVERGWIDFWRGDFDSSGLMRHTDAFEGRKLIRISKEAEQFLISESEEGYIPSEGEVAVLHLMAAAHLLQEGNREAARVELKRADQTLNTIWDDPALRLWSAGLWAAIGEWWEAQVDLRRAYNMTKNPEFKKLAEERAPQKLFLHFHGVGPELRWHEGNYTPEFVAPGKAPSGPMVLSTMPWYQRHTQRNHALRDTLIKSNYMVQYLGGEAETAAQKTGKFAIVSAIKTVAIAAGAAIIAVGIYILAATKSADAGEAVEGIFIAGAAIGGAIWKGADEINSSMNEGIKSGEEKKKLDMRIYRLVRFMPEFIELKRESKCFDCKSVSLPKLGPTQVVFEQSLN